MTSHRAVFAESSVAECGLDPLQTLLDSLVATDQVTAVVAASSDRDGECFTKYAGRRSLSGPALAADDRFLVASLTKPIVASACLLLASRGQLTLADRVVDWLPAFNGGQRRPITLRHLLTHTSGLPEVWPDNVEMRERHASLADFVASGCTVEPSCRAGTRAEYSSVGYSLLGAVLEAADGRPLPRFLSEEIFEPLGMSRTSLGMSTSSDASVVEIRLPVEQSRTTWNWNSPYWRALGAPWGGLISTASDLIKYLRAFAGWDQSDLFSETLLRAAWTNQLPEMLADGASAGRRGWGLGWRMNWPGHAAALCELLPAHAVGHYGATGTVMWVSGNRCAVALTSEPALKRPRLLQQISNVIACSALHG